MSCGNRIVLIDDHPMVRAGLVQLLHGAGHKVVGQAGGWSEAMVRLNTTAADIALLDLALDGESGLGLITALKGLGLRVLVYTMHDEPYTVSQALTAGASGFVTKRETAQSLLAAVEAVARGELYLSPRADAAMRMAAPEAELTGQQLRIYQLLGRGVANEDIAEQLGISVRTLESYCVRIMDKLGVGGMRELRQKAISDAVILDG